MEAYRFFADKDNPGTDAQFPGWHLTIHQTDNDGRNAKGYLPRVELNLPVQVLEVIHNESSTLESESQIKGAYFIPWIHHKGTYSLLFVEVKTKKKIKQ